MGIIGPSNRNLRRWGMTNKPVGNEPRLMQQSKIETRPSIEEKVTNKEANGMKSEKINLLNTNGKYVFLEKYGVSTISVSNIRLNLDNDKQYSTNQVFQKKGDTFELFSKFDMLSFVRDEEWENKTYYIKDESKTNRNVYYGYGYGHEYNLVKGQEKSIKIKSIKITFVANYYTSFGSSRRTKSEEFDITIEKKEDIENYNVWLLDGFDDNKLMRPDLSDIQIGKEFYQVSNGLAKVVKVYEYPNKSNLICDLETEKGKIKKYIGLDDLYYLPYDTPKSKLIILDKCENEMSLLPYVIREGQTFNVYWRPIEEAAEYIISLYKIIEINGRKDLYHLNDYTVDRNENLFVISGLIGNTFVFKVAAEDRSGKTIALSRGIVNGYPTYFVVED